MYLNTLLHFMQHIQMLNKRIALNTAVSRIFTRMWEKQYV